MKKTIIVDTRRGSDFSMDLLFAGLVRRLGPENVIDYPPQEKHRMIRPKLVGDAEKDYGSERLLCHVVGAQDMRCWSPSEIVRELAAGNIERIFLNERPESFLEYLQLRAHLFDVPVVVVAGHDRFWNESPQMVREKYYKNRLEAMFIDDWQQEYDDLPYTHLTNLSSNFDHLWDCSRRQEFLKNKVYDICFMGYNSGKGRAAVIEHLQKKWGHLNNHIMLEKRPDTFDSFVRHDEYFSRMAQSKICINIPGASACGRALRYYEIPYVGSHMLSQTFPARLLFPFVEGQHCSYFGTLDELDEKIEHLLDDVHYRETVALAGNLHVGLRHTVDARTEQMFEVLS